MRPLARGARRYRGPVTDSADNGANGGVDGPTAPPRNGFVAWLVFILAVGAVLALAGGCMAYMYAPLFDG